MFMHFNEEHKSVIWVYCLDSTGKGIYVSLIFAVWTFSVIFPDAETDKQFKDTFASCLWEKNTGTPFSKVKVLILPCCQTNIHQKEDVEWVLRSYADDPNMEVEKDDGVQGT